MAHGGAVPDTSVVFYPQKCWGCSVTLQVRKRKTGLTATAPLLPQGGLWHLGCHPSGRRSCLCPQHQITITDNSLTVRLVLVVQWNRQWIVILSMLMQNDILRHLARAKCHLWRVYQNERWETLGFLFFKKTGETEQLEFPKIFCNVTHLKYLPDFFKIQVEVVNPSNASETACLTNKPFIQKLHLTILIAL